MRTSRPVSKAIAVTRNPPASRRRSDGRDSASPDRANPTAITSEWTLGTPRKIPKYTKRLAIVTEPANMANAWAPPEGSLNTTSLTLKGTEGIVSLTV